MKEGRFATWSQVSAKVRLLGSHRNWEIQALSPLLFVHIKKKNIPKVLEKNFPGL